MDEGTYVAFLILGLVVVVADAVMIYRSGLRYLADSSGDTGPARSMARMVSALFCLTVLGLLALVSTINFGDGGIQSVVTRLGVMLLLVAAAHAITLKVLTRARDRLDAEQKTKRRYFSRKQQAAQAQEVPVQGAPAQEVPVQQVPVQGSARDTAVAPGAPVAPQAPVTEPTITNDPTTKPRVR